MIDTWVVITLHMKDVQQTILHVYVSHSRPKEPIGSSKLICLTHARTSTAAGVIHPAMMTILRTYSASRLRFYFRILQGVLS